ncbi:MAG: GumC family protein [Sphingomonadaceae bacterium]
MAVEMPFRNRNALTQEPSRALVERELVYAPRDGTLDGSRLGQFVRENYKLFLIIFGATLGLMILYTLNATPVYTAKASVMLDQRKRQVLQGMDEVVSRLPSDSSVVDTEVEILSSSQTAYEVATRVGLVPNVDPSKMTAEQLRDASETVQQIIRNREIGRSGLTYIINIYFTAPDPQQAQSVANAFAEAYLDSQVDVRVQENERARAHLQREIAELQTKVKQADADVAAYKASTGLNSTASGTLVEQEISSYNQALAMARAQAAEDAQRLSSARAQMARGVAQLGDGASMGLMQLRSQQASASARVAELKTRYGPDHPEMMAAQQQLNDLDRAITAESNRTIASLETQAMASSGRVAALASKLASTEGELAEAGTASVRLRELESALEAPKALLAAYQGRLAVISTQSGAEQPDARLVAPAALPIRPSAPSWPVNIILGIGLGSILGMIVVLVKHVFSGGLASPAEVESTFGVDFLAALPRLRDADDIARIDHVVDDPNSAFSESLRGLAASIFYSGEFNPKVVSITSCYAEEGKTSTAISLGRSLALRGRRVLTVDCDLQRPSFITRFGIGKGVGLVDVLEGTAPLEQAIVKDGRTPGYFLPFGHISMPGQTLPHERFVGLIDHLRDQYDVIILDLPPLLQVAETRLIAACSDGAVLLARWRQTSRQAIDYSLALLSRTGTPVLGLTLTQVPVSSEIMLGGYAAPAPAALRAA